MRCRACSRPGGSALRTMLFLFRLAVFLSLWGCSHGQGHTDDEGTEEVKIEVLHRPENCSKTSRKGDLLNAHYDGYLAKDGSKFYCSRTQDEGHPKWFVLGVGHVIKGLDLAMMDMCPGEKRKVIIPPSFAYGKEGYAEGKIPPNATLMFEIELYAVTKGPRSIETFKQIDTDNDRQLSKAEIELYLQKDFEKDAKPRDKSYQNAVLEDIFKKNDHNRDGFISPKEYNVHQHDEL
ncbi:peptidyl-prolyl cis-trans isomerase FKBP7 isoform X1 [Onychomys torridus]|uniref:peptidyl-prolyl cis-trans isomerase FKBP7 isoform X1 n=1 Tax=Onychomys torridus TaxID=38674 RepID=UPI00167F597C|nr:peptidyl-prolyl cis-trans isomerase FKBP7 isoform X1 [Onychomys torridus]